MTKKIKKKHHWRNKRHFIIIGAITMITWGLTAIIRLTFLHLALNMQNYDHVLIQWQTFAFATPLAFVLLIVIYVFMFRNTLTSLVPTSQSSENEGVWMQQKQFKMIAPPTLLLSTHSWGWVVNSYAGYVPKNQFSFFFQAYQNHHALIIGSTRSGKTQKIIFPSIYFNATSQTKPSMIITDPKGAIASQCYAFLKTQDYDVKILDFITFKKDHWNILHSIQDKWQAKQYNKAELEINSLAHNFIKNIKNEQEPVWHLGAHNFFVITVLAFLSEVSAKGEWTKFNLEHLIKKCNLPLSVWQLWIEKASRKNPLVKNVAGATLEIDNSDFLRTLQHLVQIGLRGLNNQDFLKMSSFSDVNFKTLRQKPTVYFLQTHLSDPTYWSLSNLFLTSLFNFLIKKSPHQSQTSHQLLFIMDEFGNIPLLKNFSKLIATCGEYNIWFLLCLQSYHQLEKYPEYQDIIANCGVKYYLHTNDIHTASQIEKEYGNKPVKITSYHEGNKSQDSNSKTISSIDKPLISYYQLMKLKNKVIVKIQHYDPIQVEMVNSFEMEPLLFAPLKEI